MFSRTLSVELRCNIDGRNGKSFRAFLEPRWDYLRGGEGVGRASSRGRPKLWVSMGLCYSENTQLFGKSKYPYAEITPLAVLLWRHFAPDAGVLVRIVHMGEVGLDLKS